MEQQTAMAGIFTPEPVIHVHMKRNNATRVVWHPPAGGLMLDPPSTSRYITVSGERKAHLPIRKMVLLGILGGFYVSLGASTSFASMASTTPTGPVKVLGGIMFSFGLMLVVLAGAELFTGNCLLVMACLAGNITVSEMLLDWLIVYVTNFIGALIGAVLFYGTGMNGWESATSSGQMTCALAVSKSGAAFWAIFLKGIVGNILVCLAVILAATGETTFGKISGMIFPIASFVALGMEHCIANMYLMFSAGLLHTHSGVCDDFSWGDAWVNLSTSTVGNILGASLLATAYWYAHIKPDVTNPSTAPDATDPV